MFILLVSQLPLNGHIQLYCGYIKIPSVYMAHYMLIELNIAITLAEL